PPRETYPGRSGSWLILTGESGLTMVAGLPPGWPPTATRPAAISSAACARDRASPRRTSSASSRCLRPVDMAGGLLRPAVGPVRMAGLQIPEHLDQLGVDPPENRGVLGDVRGGQLNYEPDRRVDPLVTRRARAARSGTV